MYSAQAANTGLLLLDHCIVIAFSFDDVSKKSDWVVRTRSDSIASMILLCFIYGLFSIRYNSENKIWEPAEGQNSTTWKEEGLLWR